MGSIVQDVFGGFGIGQTSAEQNREAADALRKEMMDRLAKLGIPEIEAQKIILETPELLEQFIPELQGMAEQLQSSEMADLKGSPELKAAQISALNTLIGSDMDKLVDDTELQSIKRQLAQNQDNKIVESMSGAGKLGSGQELQARLESANNESNDGAASLINKSQNLLNNKLQKAQDVASMAGAQRNIDYSQSAKAAQAQDELNKFNLQNRVANRTADIEALNKANMANTGLAQQYEDKRTSIRNQQDAANKALYQQKFQNELLKAGAQGDASNSYASTLAGINKGEADSTQQQVGMAASIVGSIYSDKNLKKNISHSDDKLKELLDNIEAYDYEYLDKVGSSGKHTGVMAQDLEKSELGDRLVSNNEMGKTVDYQEAVPTMLAAQASLNKRLNKLEALLKKGKK